MANGQIIVNPLPKSPGIKAILSLVFGIISYLFCPFFAGITAWVLGGIELNDIRAGISSSEGKTIATAGMWLGIINVILSFLGIIFYIFLIILAITL